MPLMYSPQEIADISREEHTAETFQTTESYSRCQSSVKTINSVTEINARAAYHHESTAGNTFGPIESLDDDMYFEEYEYEYEYEYEHEQQLHYNSAEISSEDSEWYMLSDEEAVPQSESGHCERVERFTVRQAKSTFERGSVLCEANMFGPLDWALDYVDGYDFLEYEYELC